MRILRNGKYFVHQIKARAWRALLYSNQDHNLSAGWHKLRHSVTIAGINPASVNVDESIIAKPSNSLGVIGCVVIVSYRSHFMAPSMNESHSSDSSVVIT